MPAAAVAAPQTVVLLYENKLLPYAICRLATSHTRDQQQRKLTAVVTVEQVLTFAFVEWGRIHRTSITKREARSQGS